MNVNYDTQQRYMLIAFLATLGAIVFLALAGAWLIANQRQVEGLGIGAAMTGLIGVLGTFRPRSMNSAETEVPPMQTLAAPALPAPEQAEEAVEEGAAPWTR